MRIIGLVLCCVFLQLISAASTNAEPGISWTDQDPAVYKSEFARFVPNAYCPTYSQRQKTEYVAEDQELCIFDGDRFHLATGYFNQLGWRVAIAYPFDTKFHLLEGVCLGTAGCLYSPKTDMLVERYQAGQYFLGVHVYKHVQDRIKRVFDSISGTLQYTFDSSRPDYTVTGEDSLVLPIGSIALSNNGQWLAFEMTNVGIGEMNLTTSEKFRLQASGVTYGMGADPLIELAVTNDGKTVAVMGEGTTIRVIDRVPACEYKLEPPDITDITAPPFEGILCPAKRINTYAFTDFFYAAYHPWFDNGGDQLNFYAISYGEPTRRVNVRASNYQVNARLDYLAMGDSFSSGEGESDDSQYLARTNDQYEKCHVSRRSYPFLLAQKSLLPSDFVRSVACAGAVIGDVVGQSYVYEGQNKRLGTLGAKLSSNDQKLSQSQALDSFIPGRVHQADFLNEYEPKLSTIGVGGNDAGFMTKLKTCAMPGRCEWASSQEMIHRTGVEIRSLLDRLVAMYQELKRRSPNTKMVAIGYPEAIDPDGQCDQITGSLLDHDERVFMQEGLRYLNRVIRVAAFRAEILYADIEDSFIGSRLCESGQTTAMNGLRIGDDISPLSALPMLKVIGNESFHPNPYGHVRIAETLFSRYGDFLDYKCTSPCLAQDALTLDGYWEDSNQSPIVVQRAYQLTDRDEIDQDDSVLTIDIPQFSFKPSSSVRFELHSENIELGELQSDAFGAVNGGLVIPGNIIEGFHALHALGSLYDLSAGDLYQGITYGRLPEDEIINQLPDEGKSSVDKIATKSETKSKAMTGLGIVPGFKGVLGAMSKLEHAYQENNRGVLVKFGIWIVFLGILFLGVLVMLLLRIKQRRKKPPQDRGG